MALRRCVRLAALGVACVLVLATCGLFPKEMVVAVCGEDIRFALEPDRLYATSKAVVEGHTIQAGEMETVQYTMPFMEVSVHGTYYATVKDLQQNVLDSNSTGTIYLYPDDGEVQLIYGIVSRDFDSVEDMNQWLVDNKLSPIAGGSGTDGGDDSTPSYCTSTYQGPNSDPQRDTYCQGAWSYLCQSGYDPDSEEVQTYCELFDAMNTSGSVSCPYCK